MSIDDEPRWLEEARRELSEPVEVRESWRAALDAELAAMSPPRRPGWLERLAGPSIRVRPLVGIAAALVFMLLGGAITTAIRSGDGEPVATREIEATTSTSTGSVGSDPFAESVQFVLAAPAAHRVALVGDFNQWNPEIIPLERDAGTGIWRASVRLSPGLHLYAFVVDGDLVADPAAPRAAAVDFGTNSVVLVSSR